jgi:hypothetical protein
MLHCSRIRGQVFCIYSVHVHVYLMHVLTWFNYTLALTANTKYSLGLHEVDIYYSYTVFCFTVYNGGIIGSRQDTLCFPFFIIWHPHLGLRLTLILFSDKSILSY